MTFFDCNCCFGEMASPPFRYSIDAEELIREMDHCGIAKSLVYHAGMRFSSPITWNNAILTQLKDNDDRLFPSWTILPYQTGEMPEPKTLIASMKSCGIRVLRAFPQEHHYCLDALTFGDLFEMLIQYKIPLLVKENILKLKGLLQDFPELIVVALNQGPHSFERYLRPLLDKYPNLHLDTSLYIIDGNLEEFCERYNFTRLLFGSGYPDNCYGGSLLHLLHANLAENAKKAIASGNLEGLLREVRL